jgi:hypothetical protein
VHDNLYAIETAFELLFICYISDDQVEALRKCDVAGA